MNYEEVIKTLYQFEVKNKKSSQSQLQKPFVKLGIKMKDLRLLAKNIGTDHSLSVELYESDIYEAMMLATMIASGKSMTKALLEKWVKRASSSNIVNQGISRLMLQVPNYQLILKEWCLASDQNVRYAGFTTLSSYFGSESINTIDVDFSKSILNSITETIANEPLTIQNAMNNAVVMAGLHVPALVDLSFVVADKIGYIMPLVARNSCNIQSASDYLVRYIENPKYSRVAKLNQISSKN